MGDDAIDAPDATQADDEGFMRAALQEAERARERGEVPVGAVVVLDGEIVGRGHNLRETLQDPCAHAELIAIREAASATGSWRLERATIYVTLEPCPMCAGALVNSRMARVVFGAYDPKAGATNTLYNIGTDPRLNHRFELRGGVLEETCGQVLTQFFAQIRERKRAAKEASRD